MNRTDRGGLAVHPTSTQHGYAMAALLVGLSVIAVTTSVGLPVWQVAIRREREAELVFRGEQYVQAIALFQRRYAGTFPPDVDVLVKQRFLRRRYTDPITNTDFRVLYAAPRSATTGPPGIAAVANGPLLEVSPAARVQRVTDTGRGGVIGVVSTSTMQSLRWYNGHRRYDEWTFVVSRPTPQPRGQRQARGTRNTGARATVGGRATAGRGAGRPPAR